MRGPEPPRMQVDTDYTFIGIFSSPTAALESSKFLATLSTSPTSTPEPTSMPKPTSMPEPTSTPGPTSTPEAASTQHQNQASWWTLLLSVSLSLKS